MVVMYLDDVLLLNKAAKLMNLDSRLHQFQAKLPLVLGAVPLPMPTDAHPTPRPLRLTSLASCAHIGIFFVTTLLPALLEPGLEH